MKLRKMTLEEVTGVDSCIPVAFGLADRLHDRRREPGRWTRVFMNEMDRLTIAIGLRVDIAAVIAEREAAGKETTK